MSKLGLSVSLASLVALQLAVSCGPEENGGNGGAAGQGGTASGQGGAASAGASGGGVGGAGNAGGEVSHGGTSAGAASGGAGAGGAAGGPGGESGGGGQLVDAGDASAGDASDSGSVGAADGEPCPNGDECGEGLICVGYGNPLPNGESTACRRTCTQAEPPPDCTCTGAGFCEESAGSGGSGGTGGSGNTADGGVVSCGEVIANAGCADADPDTIDFQSGEFQGCLHWRDLGEGLGWVEYDAFGGFHYDLQTSLGWVIRSTSGAMSLAEVQGFCASFSIAGLSEWRVPTIDEARSLAGGCADTAPGGSCPLSSSCTSQSCSTGDECTSCIASGGPNPASNGYCRSEAKLCIGFHTTTGCSDCEPVKNWRYNTINGNFFAGSVSDELFPVCVMENIPKAVPCRN